MKKAAVRETLLDVASIVFGCGLVAAGLVLFTIPNEIAPGGVSGLATALAFVSPVSVGTWTLMLNVPLILIAWKKLGVRPILKTILGSVTLGVGIDLLIAVLPAYTNNPLLAAVLGGVLCGAGMGLVFLRGGSTGGTDLVSLLVQRQFPNLSIGLLLMLADAAVVLFAVLVFSDIEVALYSIVTLFVTSKTIDSILQGADHAKVLYVVTLDGETMRATLESGMDCGVTMLQATGGYTGQSKHLLMIVVRRGAFAQTLAAVKRIDPAAFLFVTNAAEVHGEGFKPMQ